MLLTRLCGTGPGRNAGAFAFAEFALHMQNQFHSAHDLWSIRTARGMTQSCEFPLR